MKASSVKLNGPVEGSSLDSFLQDIHTLGKELMNCLPSDDKKKKKKSNIKDVIPELQNIDVLNINIGKLDFEEIKVKKMCKNKKFPQDFISSLNLFDEHTIGKMVITTLYDCIKESFHSANATELNSKLSSKKFLIYDESHK